MWSISSSRPYYSMEGHSKGVNCLDFYPGNDKPYLATGSDDCVPFSLSLFLSRRSKSGTTRPRRAFRRSLGTKTTSPR